MSLLPVRTFRSAIMAVTAAFAATVLAAVLAAFVVPAVTAMLPAIGSVPTVAAADTAGEERLWAALRFTLLEALLSSLIAVVIGLPAAFLVARRRFPGRRLLLSLSGIPLCVPPVIIALAFVLFYGRQGYLNAALMSVCGLTEPPVTFLYSLAGVVIAHGFYNFPVVLRTVSQVWERLPENEEEAALLLGAGNLRVFRTITLPRLAAPILASAVLVFLYCFFSFVIVLLFGGVGGTTLEVELYRAARSSLDFRFAGRIALLETIAALAIVFAYVWLQKYLSQDTAGLRRDRLRPAVGGAGETAAVLAYALFLVVFFIGPLLSIFVRSFLSAGNGIYTDSMRFSLSAWVSFFGRPSFLAALRNTLTVGVSAAIISTLAALCFALARTNIERRSWFAGSLARRKASGNNKVRLPHTLSSKPSNIFFRILPLSPLAVSSVILGFGWTLLVPRGNIVVLILAQSALAWPFAWTQIQSSLDRIPDDVHAAAAMLSSGRFDTSFRVLIPLVLPGILSGAGFVFAISAGDASLPLILSLNGFENLALTLFRLAGSYRFSEACVCAVVMAAMCGGVFFLQERGAKHE